MTKNLPALEKNILKFRALQMVLLLHQVESLRDFVIKTIRATDSLMASGTEGRLPANGKRTWEKALGILVADGIVTQTESEDIVDIIDIRNDVGHRIHELVADITRPKIPVLVKKNYDYRALRRLEQYRRKISAGMMGKYILSVGFRDVLFNPAEAAYKEELDRLERRINRLYEVRRTQIHG